MLLMIVGKYKEVKALVYTTDGNDGIDMQLMFNINLKLMFY